MTEKEKLGFTPEMQHLLMQLQAYQQQTQALAMQMQQFEIQSMELDAALEELVSESAPDEVFKSAGPILVKRKKDEVEKELKDDREIVKVRIDALKKQENRLREKMKELSAKLSPLMKGTGVADMIFEGG